MMECNNCEEVQNNAVKGSNACQLGDFFADVA
jgi:hypothetical protein